MASQRPGFARINTESHEAGADIELNDAGRSWHRSSEAKRPTTHTFAASDSSNSDLNEKGENHYAVHEVDEDAVRNGSVEDVDMGEVVVPHDDAEFIDPRLKDYPIPLVAKTVDLHNDPT